MKLKIRRWLRGVWFDWKYRGVPRGYCCCGDKVENHGVWAGHSPVDEYFYYRDDYVRAKEKRPARPKDEHEEF